MSQGTLVGRLERSRIEIAHTVQTRDFAQRELNALQAAASALEAVATGRHAVDLVSHDRPRAAMSSPPSLAAGDPLPLVLSNRSISALSVQPRNVEASSLEPRRFFAPVLLAGSLVLLAALMAFATPEQPKPRFARAPATAPVVALQPVSTEAVTPLLAPSSEELALIERCEALIGRGDIRSARQELARAAADGSAHARFALAETFDPNMLAAWGMRENVADAQIARTLYAQSMSAGDGRAASRLAALID